MRWRYVLPDGRAVQLAAFVFALTTFMFWAGVYVGLAIARSGGS